MRLGIEGWSLAGEGNTKNEVGEGWSLARERDTE